MARPRVTVIRLTADTIPALVDLWVQRRVEGGLSPQAVSRSVRSGRVATAVEDPAVTVFLAFLDEAAVGYAVATTGQVSLTADQPSLTIQDVFVVPALRGRGVGIALLTGLAGHAERQGITQVGVAVPAQARAAHRTLARLGFAPTITRRMTATSALMRRLDPQRGTGHRVVVKRRSLRGPGGATPPLLAPEG